MIRGAIFDIDGVVLDSMGIWKDLGVRYLKHHGLTPEEGLGETLFSMSMEEGAAYLKKQYQLLDDESEILSEIHGMLDTFYFEEVECKDGVSELLQFLKDRNISMIAATSSPRTHVERALERNGLLSYFTEVLTTTEVGKSKHFPDIYDHAADQLGRKPQEILVFEDSLYALLTAKHAGYHIVGVYDGEGERRQEELQKESEYYIVSYKDFDFQKLV